MDFYFKRTLKVAISGALVLSLLSLLSSDSIETFKQYYPYAVMTVAFMDVGDYFAVQGKALYGYLLNKVTESKISKQWDLEERVHDFWSKYGIIVAIIFLILYFIIDWMWMP